jgi:pimeloyl-ACP methyl ester carboxylesterase
VAEVAPFEIDVPDSELEDLRRRLRNTRWPDAEPVDDWSQGIPLAYVQDVCAYWANGYDWRARERSLNRFDQFITEIDGVHIHFVHMRSPHETAEPLMLSHGWPSSIVEFHKVIEPLLDPPAHGGDAADAFHVVAPSLPGYGFSGKPTETGWDVDKIATVFAELMARLGYDRYFAQGGDWGSVITGALGALDADRCAGIHLTLPLSSGRVEGEPTPEEERALAATEHYWKWESGYSYQQATKPQTIGYSLVDSPVGLAAWILEKYQTWTDNDGHLENVLTLDELLDNVMFYWVNKAGASSARLYWESFFRGNRHTASVPSGFAVFPKEIVPAVRKWVEKRYTNIHHWSEFDRGGHFPALEMPDTYVTDVRECFRPIRQ